MVLAIGGMGIIIMTLIITSKGGDSVMGMGIIIMTL